MSLAATPLVQIMSNISGIAPLQLLDVLALDGTSYHWASFPVASAAALGCPPVLTGNPPAWNALQGRIVTWDDTYLPWLLTAGPFHLSRSMQSNIGDFTVQNVSGNTVQRDVSTIAVKTAFEGAIFAYREWSLEAQAAEFEMHGRLTVISVTEMTAQFAGEQLFNPSNYQAPDFTYSETCPLIYASPACGDTTNNPCSNSFPTCRVPERFQGVLNTFQTDLSPSEANVSTRVTVRRRQV